MDFGNFLNSIRLVPLTHIFKGITFLGNEECLSLALPLIYWCWKKRSGIRLMLLVILSSFLAYMLKDIFAWDRPPTDLWLISASGFTFPSTHAVLAVVIWGFIAYEIRKTYFSIFAVTIILLISFSRVYLGVHYFQDVIGGMAVGAVFLYSYKFFGKYVETLIHLQNVFVVGIATTALSIGLLILSPSVWNAEGYGLFAGLIIGYLVEPHLADFTPRCDWKRNILKAILATGIMVSIWEGLNWIFPDIPSFRWFEYFIIGNWITGGAPWMFVQLRLARREPD